MPKLHCKNATFYSEKDELTFFEWIGTVPCIKKREHLSDTVVLHVRTKKISDTCLRELLALFFRYEIEMTQLGQFANEENSVWFVENRSSYWFKKVFKNSRI